MNIKETALILAQVSVTFPNFTLTSEAIKAWYGLFQNEAYEVFHSAMRLAVKEPGREFFPTPGQIQKIITEIKLGELPHADEVWTKVLQFASQGNEAGAREYLKGNVAGERALNRVSFRSLRMANVDTELPWLRKEFIQSYTEHTELDARVKFITIGRDEARQLLLSRPETAKLIQGEV